MKNIIVGFLLIFAISVHSQKPVLQMGMHTPPPEAKKRKNYYSQLIAGNDNEILISDRA